MDTEPQVYKIIGQTYLIRFYLTLCGCHWNGIYWFTTDREIKSRLIKAGLTDKNVKSLRLEKIERKPIDKVNE